MSEMKAGPELDAKLCQLLEPKPADTFPWEQPDSDIPLYESHKGFWTRDFYMCMGSPDWEPIPVSTDWAVMGKVVEAIKQLGLAVTLSDGYASRALATVKPQKGWLPLPAHCIGDDLPHALTLAAIEALEKRAEAAP